MRYIRAYMFDSGRQGKDCQTSTHSFWYGDYPSDYYRALYIADRNRRGSANTMFPYGVPPKIPREVYRTACRSNSLLVYEVWLECRAEDG